LACFLLFVRRVDFAADGFEGDATASASASASAGASPQDDVVEADYEIVADNK